ncbi:MAG TPA: hypothetical protein VJ914_25515 [Pseudonocardiaceae bacterium]|nr:hypothetical protein [Pseudonocardiaceae bacterium]
MAVVDVDAVPGTGSARRRLLRIGLRLALTAGFVVAGWLLFGLAASAASASVLPQTSASSPSDSTDGGGLLGGLLGNTVSSLGTTVDNLTGTVNTTVGSVLGTVDTTLNSTLGTVGSTVNSVTTSVGTTVVTPTVTTVTKTVTPVVSPLLPVKSTPASAPIPPATPAVATNPLPAQPSPAPAAEPLVKPEHHATAKSVPVKATRPTAQLRPVTPPLPMPKAPQPAPQQPLAPAPTVSTGHGPTGGNKHAISAITANASGSAPALLTTVASHPIIVPGEMPGLPSVSPD